MQGTTLSAGDWWVRCRGAEGSGHLQGCRRFRTGAGVKGGWWVTYRGLQGVQVRHKGQNVGGGNG